MELSKLLTSLYIFHNLTDPLFLIPEYINGLIDSLLSLKRLEAFLFSKEYNPSQLINKNPKNKKEEKNEVSDNINTSDNSNEDNREVMIYIDDIEFGIIKREEEFMVIDENDEDSDEEKKKKRKKKRSKRMELQKSSW